MRKDERIIITLKAPREMYDNKSSIADFIKSTSGNKWDSRDVSVPVESSLCSLLEYIGLADETTECYNQKAQKLNLQGSFETNHVYNGSIVFIIPRGDV